LQTRPARLPTSNRQVCLYPYVSYAGAVAVEVVGGILLVLGYQTRVVALVVAAYSVAAAVGFHTDFADQNQMIHFLKNLAVAGGLLQIVSFGAGAFSLDARRGTIGHGNPHRTNTGGAQHVMTQI
jgi:putative oxidoreductase